MLLKSTFVVKNALFPLLLVERALTAADFRKCQNKLDDRSELNSGFFFAKAC